MTLTLPGVDVLPPVTGRQRALSQWWTPPELAARVAHLALDGTRFASVLEPAAGAGALVDAVLAARPMARVTALELDPTWVRHLTVAYVREPVRVLEGDFLTTTLAPVDVVCMNPPYESGLDGAFLERAMELAPRVVALLRLNALVGQERHERVWSRTLSDVAELIEVAKALDGLLMVEQDVEFLWSTPGERVWADEGFSVEVWPRLRVRPNNV